MLYSQGVSLDALGIADSNGRVAEVEPHDVWRLFAQNYHLFRGTSSRMWLDHVFGEVFGFNEPLSAETADTYYQTIESSLKTPAFLPRALFDQFNIEVIATTESPLDSLEAHASIAQSDWNGRVVTTFRPDPVVDPEFEGFAQNVARLGELTDQDTRDYAGYLTALRASRQHFIEHGATAGARLIDGREIIGAVSFVSRSADPITRTFLVEITVKTPTCQSVMDLVRIYSSPYLAPKDI